MSFQQTPIEEIQNNVLTWTHTNVNANFQFRPNQFESIVGIIYSIINNGLENNIIQAPTGTGKSFICIIAAGVLAKYYDIKSYILASDLFLWKQYADAIDKFHLEEFGYLKGSLGGNYQCEDNYQDYNMGTCKIKRVSLNKFRTDKKWVEKHYPCARTCQYLIDRFRAEKTSVTLLTYQLWLYQVNLVKNDDPSMGFTQRPVIFCDECHNIPDIVSRFAQPQISAKYDRGKILTICDYAIRHRIDMPFVKRFMKPELAKAFRHIKRNEYNNKHVSCDSALDVDRVMNSFDYTVSCLNLIMKEFPIKVRGYAKVDVLHDYDILLSFINELGEECLKNYNKKKSEDDPNSKLTKSDILELSSINWIHNYYSTFYEYIVASKKAGQQYIVIEKTEDDNQLPTFTFYCVKEDYLCNEYLLSKAKYKVMTSATVGNVYSFMANIGIDVNRIQNEPNYVAYTVLPSIFDFQYSPIFYLPNYKMSFKEKSYSFPQIQKIIYKICEMYPDLHGMINTGSYINSRQIVNNAPPHIKKRLCSYDSSKTKDVQIEKFRSSKNKILIGPTLVEGVDLPGDLCRFIIIVKLPYPNLSSPLTRAKSSLFPLWYTSTTSNTMIQNIGRGVRFQGDWCYTFILDGCFDSLYNQTYQQYGPEIQQRFVRITPEYLDEQYKIITQNNKN